VLSPSQRCRTGSPRTAPPGREAPLNHQQGAVRGPASSSPGPVRSDRPVPHTRPRQRSKVRTVSSRSPRATRARLRSQRVPAQRISRNYRAARPASVVPRRWAQPPPAARAEQDPWPAPARPAQGRSPAGGRDGMSPTTCAGRSSGSKAVRPIGHPGSTLPFFGQGHRRHGG
jgi:hypothetical protein